MNSEVTDGQRKFWLGDKVRLKPEYPPIESVKSGEIGEVISVDGIMETGPVYKIGVRFKNRKVGSMFYQHYELVEAVAGTLTTARSAVDARETKICRNP